MDKIDLPNPPNDEDRQHVAPQPGFFDDLQSSELDALPGDPQPPPDLSTGITPVSGLIPVRRLANFPDQPRRPHGEPPATIANTQHLVRELGFTVRYNTIKKKIEILLPISATTTTDNADNVALTHIMSAAALHGMQLGQIPAYVEVVADLNPYNPVAKWIESRPWDGEDRLPALYATIETREDFPQQLKTTLLYRWLLSCVAAALTPRGFKARGVLTFQGPQGIGKTSWIRNLVPDEALRDAVIKVDHHLDASNKDTILGAISHWIVEIGELDSTFRKDVARLKGFLTSDQDKVRRPYARGESEYARRTVFAATVNESNFLVDLTGNTRWWTLPVEKIVFDHGIDMQQVFAQLAVDFGQGVQWWLTAEEEASLERCNRDHLNISAIREQLVEKLNLSRPPTSSDLVMGASEILRKLLGMERPTNAQAKECAGCLREWLGDPKKINGNMKWRIPLSEEAKKGLTEGFFEVPRCQ